MIDVNKKYDEAFVTKIEQTIARFESRVSFQDVLHWLSNFCEMDRDVALSLLNYVNFYTSDRILSSLSSSLKEIKQIYPKNVRFLAVRKIKKNQMNAHMGGQSGDLISYYVKKVIEALNLKTYYSVIEEMELPRYANKTTYHFILVDDFSGSGDTILDYYDYIKDKLPKICTISVLTIGYMNQAYLRLCEKFDYCFGEKIIPVFDDISGLAWLNKFKTDEYRLLAFKYGNQLYDSKTGNITAFGYKDSQALLAFEYGTPNNTLPIIWANPAEGSLIEWTPIFPRNAATRIENYLRNKRGLYRWIAYASEANLFNQSKPTYKFNNIRNFLVLLLISKHKSEFVICNTLSIGLEEFAEITEECRQYRLLDSVNNLTFQGEMFIRRYNKDAANANNLSFCKTTYIPKTFNGIS